MIEKINNYLSKRRYLLLISIILVTISTFGLTLLPIDTMVPNQLWDYDKAGHLAIFGGWTFLVGYYRFLSNPKSVNLFSIFAMGVLFGVVVEGLQYALPLNRAADLFDIAFDAIGCFIAVLVLYKITDQ
jgi:hypothetical protein